MIDIRLDGTTDGSGDLAITHGSAIHGLLYAVEWIDGDLSDGVDAVFTVSGLSDGPDVTLITLTNANDDKWYYPRTLEHDNAGAELSTYNYPVITGKPKMVISSGGATKSGGAILHIITEV